MAKSLRYLKHIRDYADAYENVNNGLVFIQDGNTGMRYSCHANIAASGSIRGMKAAGYWRRDDRCIKSNGFIYNIDTLVVNDALSREVAKLCMCAACKERRKKGRR